MGRGVPGAGALDAPAAPLDTATTVETPEHIELAYRLAGPAQRAAAWSIDAALRLAVLFAIAMPFLADEGAARGQAAPGESWSSGLMLVALFLLEWVYFVLFEWAWSGRTPGKRVLSLRVVKEAGHPIGFGDSVLRNLLRAADFLPAFFAVGGAVMSSDSRFRRLGDLVAGTMVIIEERTRLEAPLRIAPPSPSELRGVPSRVTLLPGELEAIELYLRRGPALSPAQAEELAGLLAPRLASRLGVRYSNPERFLGVLYHVAALADRGGAPSGRPARDGARAA